MISAIKASQNSMRNTAAMLFLGILSIMLLFSNIWESWLLSAFALIYYAAFSYYILRAYPAAFVLLLYFIAMRFTTMISGIAIESGGYMHEILIQGEATGAFVRLAGVYTVAILFMAVVITAAIKYIPKISPKTLHKQSQAGRHWVIAVFALIALLCGVATMIGIQNGFPLLTGMDRITYWRNIDNRFFYFFLGNRFIFSLLLGLVFSISKGWIQKAALAQIILILGISFLFAEKFTSIVVIICAFIIPVFLLNEAYLKTLSKRLIPIGLILVCLTLPVILVVYGVFEDPQIASQKLQARATSQAQVWFLADLQQDKEFDYNNEKTLHNIKSMSVLDGLAVANTKPYLGVKDIMFESMDPRRYKNYVRQGITLTMGAEGYLLKLFGSLGMLPVYLALLSVYTLQLLYLYYAVQCVDPIRVILAAKILFWSNFALNQGYFWYLFGLKSLVVIGVIVFYELIIRAVFSKQRAKG